MRGGKPLPPPLKTELLRRLIRLGKRMAPCRTVASQLVGHDH
jgi:hypothetical protein